MTGKTQKDGLWRLAAFFALMASVVHAFLSVMSGVFSLDEGYVMITVQSFLGGQSLYDTVYTQYGPAYYLYEWVVHAVLQVPLTHDATRLLTVMHWVVAAVMLGLAGGRLLRSRWAGLFVFMQAFAHLGAMANEPGHPQELVAVLLATAMVIVTWPASGNVVSTEPNEGIRGHADAAVRWHGLAAVAAVLVLIKINVGVLFGLSLAAALVWTGPSRLRTSVFKGFMMACFVALPFVLMRRHLGSAWCQHYAVLVACGAAAVLVVVFRQTPAIGLSPRGLGGILLWFLAPSAGILAAVMVTGTTATGLLDGLLLTPLKTPSIALLPLKLPFAVMVNAMVSVVLAVLWALRPDLVGARVLVPMLKGLTGLTGAFAIVGIGELQLGWLLPWAWLIVIPPAPGLKVPDAVSAARVFLALAAVWQGLQAYPIAGSQMCFATLLLVLVQGVCLWDAAAWLRDLPRFREEMTAFNSKSHSGLVALAGPFILVGLFVLVWIELPAVWRHFNTWEPLRLPGSQLMRFDPEGARRMRALMSYLTVECDTFLTYPGYNSFYFWTGKHPPTHLNATGWGLLTHARQELILDAVRRHPRARIVVVTELVKHWPRSVPEPLVPLGAFVLNECRVVREFDTFTILEVKSNE